MNNWKRIEEFTEVELQTGRDFLFYHKDWIDEEFCQDGIKIGYATNALDDKGIEFAIATIDGEGEWNHTYDLPTHFMAKPEPPKE